jgi:hypothetical protein
LRCNFLSVFIFVSGFSYQPSSAALIGLERDSVISHHAIKRRLLASHDERMAKFRPMGRSEQPRVLFADLGDED